MNTETNRSLLLERGILLALTILFLVVFNRTLPDGDALRVVRQITAQDLQWNPNHLLFDPLGFAWHGLLTSLGIRIEALASFEWISAISTLVTLWVFHRVLVVLELSRFARLTVLAALFASAGFLVTSVGQYFFMVQMPFLVGALLYLCKWLQLPAADQTTGPTTGQGRRWLLAAGALAAVATTLMFNNLLMVLLVGAALCTVRGADGRWGFANTLWFAAGAAAVGLPVFIGGFVAYSGSEGFFQWLTSYQGEADSSLNDLYGTTFTLKGMIEAAAQVVYNLLVGNQVETAGLGPVLSVVLLGKQVEFVPSWPRIIAGAVVAVAVALLTITTLLAALRDSVRSPLARLLVCWIAAYCLFNFLWSAPIEIFWFQVLPAMWILAASMLGLVPSTRTVNRPLRQPGVAFRASLAGFVALLFVVNTVNAVVPVSLLDMDGMARQHQALLKSGDLEVLPGWDQQKWIYVEKDSGVSQFVLMNAAAFSKGGAKMSALRETVDRTLDAGGRVIVARLYDADADMMPWYSLAKTGWPRQKIQELLSPLCNRVIGQVSDVTFRELYRCPAKS